MRPSSLQRQLLILLILPLALLLVANSLLLLNQARATAGLITDHNLLASARSMAQSIHRVNGVTEVEIAPSAIELLASSERDMVYYQLRGPDGAMLAGSAELPTEDKILGIDDAFYADKVFRGQPVRIVRVNQPVPGSTSGLAAITVAQTLAAREKLVRELWLKGLAQQSALVVAAAALVWFGLKRGLAPLKHLRDAMAERPTGALTRLEAPQAPAEVQPLVSALNDYIARLNLLMETQRRFVANAAHQLRTPLTLLKTQTTFGLRESTNAGKNEALSGLSTSLDHLTRLTNQLLVLARAEPGTNHGARLNTDLVPIIHTLMQDFAPVALDRNIDFGLEQTVTELIVHGNPTLLRELMANLIDNALRYTPPCGMVTVKLAQDSGTAIFAVQDSGPGILPAERDKVFERFYRVAGTTTDGSGLGLAIVHEILATHNGTIQLATPASGTGLEAVVKLPGA